MREVATAGGKRSDPPERAGKALEIGRRPVEMRRRRAQAHARPGGREIGQERCKQLADRTLNVGAGKKRIC